MPFQAFKVRSHFSEAFPLLFISPLDSFDNFYFLLPLPACADERGRDDLIS